MNVLFTCGGTAGHVNPAVALAHIFQERHPGCRILFVGADGGMENKLVPKEGYQIRSVTITNFHRSFAPADVAHNLGTLMNMRKSKKQARAILDEFKPDLVVGTGGYASYPAVHEAARRRIPCAIHESNAYPGVTTRMLAKSVQAVMLAVPDAKRYFDASVNCVVTGNPVRPEILLERREEARRKCGVPEGKLCILSFGGSLGAQRVNEAVADVMAWHTKEGKIHHIHATGQYGTQLLPRLLTQRGVAWEGNPNLDIREYIDDMPACLAAADLVICRAGASTLSELTAAGRASVLIPSPNVAENHQYHNAMALVRRGAAEIIEEKDLAGEALWAKVEEILSDPQRLRSLGENAGKLEITDASERIYRELKKAAGGGKA